MRAPDAILVTCAAIAVLTSCSTKPNPLWNLVGSGGSSSGGSSGATTTDATSGSGTSQGTTGTTTTSSAGTGQDESSGAASTGSGGDGMIEDCLDPVMSWRADFDTDPTTDGWTVRGGGPFPIAQLLGGVWISPAGFPVDTTPKYDFPGTTIIRARLRSTSVPPSDDRGGVVWLNAGYGGGSLTLVFVAVGQQPDLTQTVRLFTKSDNSTIVELGRWDGFDADQLVSFALELDVVAGTVVFELEGQARGTFPVPSFPQGTNDDRFATVHAYDAAADFDDVLVLACD